MTAKQSNLLVNNPNTKKALAVLKKFADTELQYKAVEKEAKAATELIKQAMIDNNIDKIDVDIPGLTGYITLAERTNYVVEDISEVDDSYKKMVLDTDKIKAQAVLIDKLPAGVTETKTQYITKRFKVGK